MGMLLGDTGKGRCDRLLARALALVGNEMRRKCNERGLDWREGVEKTPRTGPKAPIDELTRAPIIDD